MRDPSLFAKYFEIRRFVETKNRAGILCFRATSSRSMCWISSILSSTGTSASLRASGTDQFDSTGGSGANEIGSLRFARFASRTAASTIARTSVFLSRFVAAKPREPPASTRTPMPRLSEDSSASTVPFLIANVSSACCSNRASAYVAPLESACSTAKSTRSSMARPPGRETRPAE